MNDDVTNEPAKTLSVPEAGAVYFGLSRGAAYAAAERGDLPVIRIGRLLRVPVRALERMLDKAADPRDGKSRVAGAPHAAGLSRAAVRFSSSPTGEISECNCHADPKTEPRERRSRGAATQFRFQAKCNCRKK